MGMSSSHSVEMAWCQEIQNNKDKSFHFVLKKLGGNCKTPDEGEKEETNFYWVYNKGKVLYHVLQIH